MSGVRSDRGAPHFRRGRADLQGLRVLHHGLWKGWQGPAHRKRNRCLIRVGAGGEGGGHLPAPEDGRRGRGIREGREEREARQEEGIGVTETIRAELARVAGELGAGGAQFVLERPREPEHGDLATNLALVVARSRKANPRQVALEVVAALALPRSVVDKVEIAGPGFINFWLAGDQLATALHTIVLAGEDDRVERSEEHTSELQSH